MNGIKAVRKPRSRSGSAASNSESELTLGSSTPVKMTDSMSEHNITSSTSRKSKCHQAVHNPNPSYAERGAIGDGGYQLEKQTKDVQPEDSFQPAPDLSDDDVVSTCSSEKQPDFSDPIFRKLSRLNGEINRMRKEELRQKLAELHLHAGGVKEVLKKRLKNYYRRKKLIAANVKNGVGDNQYDYLIIIDFEATCQDNNDKFIHEIIEFPAVLVDVQQKEIVGMFREFCRPTLNPVLSEFCKTLTGVNQSEVDNASEFPAVLNQFEEWMQARGLGCKHSFAVVTDGPWDIQRFMSKQCEISKLPFPRWARRWINLRKAFCNFYDCKRLNLQHMLTNLGLQFEGRPHCGLDDSKNIARIVCHLLEDGCIFKVNEVFDNRSNLPKPSRFVDTGDGMHSGDYKPMQKKTLAGGLDGGNGVKREKSVKELSGLETDEEISDLMYYFELQSS
ncbi:3'-5' exoribonuclease 1-like [Littorina saxatilis]|uniref:3'-5' exoribonuclease 1 n=1 Tax=Littorina saxatilis TaxID=31220 RepID=A0AAN9BQJ6_9CAEN